MRFVEIVLDCLMRLNCTGLKSFIFQHMTVHCAVNYLILFFFLCFIIAVFVVIVSYSLRLHFCNLRCRTNVFAICRECKIMYIWIALVHLRKYNICFNIHNQIFNVFYLYDLLAVKHFISLLPDSHSIPNCYTQHSPFPMVLSCLKYTSPVKCFCLLCHSLWLFFFLGLNWHRNLW